MPMKSMRSTLKRAIRKDKENQNDIPKKRISITRPEILHTFLSHEQVNQYLKFVESRYSQFVKLHTIGLSYEHREIRAIEINWNSPRNTLCRENSNLTSLNKQSPRLQKGCSRNMVFIEAGAHAREWITISVALSCIYQLVENYKRHTDILKKLKFFIVPLLNPDGYEYSRLKNKKWRKNRRPHRHSSFVGTDCNRNYDFHWEKGSTKASYCTYKGEKPFSEPETRAMRDILARLNGQILFFLSLHSCGQSIMYPWAYSKDETPMHQKELEELATAGRNAILGCNGRQYRVGCISKLINHCVSGSVVDYAHGKMQIPLSLVMELPSREMGFQPPKEMISPLGYESWFGIREMCLCAYHMGVGWENQTFTEPSRDDSLSTTTTSTKTRSYAYYTDKQSASSIMSRSANLATSQMAKPLTTSNPTNHNTFPNFNNYANIQDISNSIKAANSIAQTKTAIISQRNYVNVPSYAKSPILPNSYSLEKSPVLTNSRDYANSLNLANSIGLAKSTVLANKNTPANTPNTPNTFNTANSVNRNPLLTSPFSSILPNQPLHSTKDAIAGQSESNKPTINYTNDVKKLLNDNRVSTLWAKKHLPFPNYRDSYMKRLEELRQPLPRDLQSAPPY